MTAVSMVGAPFSRPALAVAAGVAPAGACGASEELPQAAHRSATAAALARFMTTLHPRRRRAQDVSAIGAGRKRIERVDRVFLELVLQGARRKLEQTRRARAVATRAHERQADQALFERTPAPLDREVLARRAGRVVR